MKTTELTPEEILTVVCPTCGVAAGKACELTTGSLRNAPHRDRAMLAAPSVERKRAAKA